MTKGGPSQPHDTPTKTGSRPIHTLCWLALSCSAAMFLAVRLLPEGSLFLVGLCCLLTSLLALFFHGSLRQRVFLAALGAAVGLLWTGCYQHLVRIPARELISEEALPYTLEVTGSPKETQWGASFTARLITEDGPGPRVQFYGEEDTLTLQPGDMISAKVKLAPSDLSRGEPVEHHEARGIFLLGYAQGATTLLERPPRLSLRYWPGYAAATLKASVAALFPEDVGGFLTALLTGDKSLLPDGLYAAFQRAGLAHIVAVSGLHIGFLAGLCATLFPRRTPFSTGVTVLFLFFFAAMAGSSPSALRAACMAAFLLIAPLVNREADPPTILSLTLILLLFPCPYSLSSKALQLSFAAMAGIYLVGIPLFRSWTQRLPAGDKPLQRLLSSLARFCLSSLSITVGVLLFTAPLTALYFHSVSLVWPISNLLCLGLVSVTFLGCLLTALLGLFLPSAGIFLAFWVSLPARWIMALARSLSRLPFASVSILSGYLVLWFFTAYLILLLWYLGRKQTRPLLPASALALTLLAAFFAQNRLFCRYPLTVTALDVGQGASTLFTSQRETLLVDCGGNTDNAGDIAADYLQSLGRSHLDTLILTHCHSDHANGVPELMARLPVSRLILPDTNREDPLRREIIQRAEETGCQVEFLTADSTISLGAASLTLYAPLGDGGANEEGLSLLCSLDCYDILVTGDMNDVVEKRLIKYKSLPDIELLMVGHHGSKSSTSEALLLATTPETAVISSGYNSYGHPAAETLERLGAAGCDIYRTDQMGHITFYIEGGAEE